MKIKPIKSKLNTSLQPQTGARRRILLLISIIAVVTIGVTTITLITLYNMSLEQQKARLIEIVQSQARLMEAIARHEVREGEDPFNATLEQIRDAREQFEGFGETGEFTLAKREDDQIVFLLRQRHHDLDNPEPVPFDSTLAEPMRRALAGQSGTVIGLDYHGEEVLAAYEPVAELDLGIVAKIDWVEIQAPFIRTGWLAGTGGLILILLGTVIFHRISDPLIRAFEENERKYRTLFESATSGVFLMADVVEECNDQASTLLGYQCREIIGKSLVDFSPPTQPDGRASDQLAYERIQAAYSGKSQFFYWQLRHQESYSIDTEISLVAVEVGGRQVILATLHDITGQKQAQQALQESEERLAAFMQYLPGVAFIKDGDGRHIAVNQQFEGMYQLSREQWYGKTNDEIFPPDIAGPFNESDQFVMTTGLMTESLQTSYRQSEPTYWLTYKFPLLKHNNTPAMIGGIAIDITARKQAEEALRALMTTFSAISGEEFFIRVSRHLVMTLGMEYAFIGELVGNNDTVHVIGGFGKGEILEPFNYDLAETPCENVIEQTLSCYPTGVQELFPNDHLLVDMGIDGYIGSPIFKKSGQPLGIIVLLNSKPITNQNVAESMLQIFVDRVSAEIERKQAEGDREQLIEELEARNAEMERFAYTISHDLKSPLITIRGFVGMLEKDVAEGNAAELREDVQYINDAVDQMKLLLDDLLELSRIGRLVNPSEEVSLTELANEAVGLVTGQIAQRHVQVEIALDMPTVYGDRCRLLEVLQNLIDNAVKFMGDQPAPHVKIGVSENGDETVCYVRDNGMGIDPQYHEKIFGLFERLSQAEEGSGVGLALVKRIVELHNGRVWVESKGHGSGSTFYFTLPQKGATINHEI